MKPCRSFESLLSLFANGELEASQAERVAAHLAHCPACRKEVEVYRHFANQVQSLPAPLVPEHALRGFSQEVMNRIAEPQQRLGSRVVERLRLFLQSRPRSAFAAFATAVLVFAFAIWYSPFEQAGKPQLAQLLQARAWDKLYYALLEKETRAVLLHEPIPVELAKTALGELFKKSERDKRLRAGLRLLFPALAGREPKTREGYESAKIFGVITARGYRPAPRKRSLKYDTNALLHEVEKLPDGEEVTLADLVKPKE